MSRTSFAGPQVVVGFTAPSVTLSKMKQIDGQATDLNARMLTDVSDTKVTDAWSSWLKGWREFYSPYAVVASSDPGLWDSLTNIPTGLATLFISDELASRTEEYRIQLERWKEIYTSKTAQPAPGVPIPAPPGPPPPGGSFTQAVPWYYWTALGAGGILALYLGWRFYLKPKLFVAGDPRPTLPLPPARTVQIVPLHAPPAGSDPDAQG